MTLPSLAGRYAQASGRIVALQQQALAEGPTGPRTVKTCSKCGRSIIDRTTWRTAWRGGGAETGQPEMGDRGSGGPALVTVTRKASCISSDLTSLERSLAAANARRRVG